MALKATIFKATLHISDLDRGYYADHDLTLARHPSENDERLMVRLLAFALFAEENLQFTKGLSSDDEPELWQMDDTGAITLWIEVGMPDEKRIRKGCNRGERAVVLAYGRPALVWWKGIEGKLARFDNLTVLYLEEGEVKQLADLAERSLELNVTIQEGQVWVGAGDENLLVAPKVWKGA
ncbi:MAG: hypothetical protein COX57_08195 [Alphaproteobacteria bacterium CG_4_10_14_0_2_um_filter_63_37]|nr:MAG: hypothetical protein AUJ55_07740 [Proteobacteria bacterium CG1_02_64_396]PJA24438.1 MAG: hypothetical protein COX57_08195 [Alphaproteobacteria bacterium CG_4_10_14_0_2_um_filter_63_37]